MRRLLPLLLSVVLLPAVWGQSACEAYEDTKIGYVNYRQVRNRAPQIPLIKQKLAKEFSEQRKKIIASRNAIAELINSHSNGIARGDQSQEALDKLQKTIDEKQIELNQLQQRTQNEYNLRRSEESKKLQTLIVDTVAKIAKEEKLVYVQNETAVVYVNSCIDISPKVLRYLSEQNID